MGSEMCIRDSLCTALLVVGVVFQVSTEHYIITGLGVAACLFSASVPWICRSLDNGVIRLTKYSRRRVHERMLKFSEPAFGTPVKWEFDEEGFRTRMLDMERRVSWSELKRVRTLPKFWMFRTKRDELLFPTAALTDSVRDLIRSKAMAAGAKIVEG